MLRGFFFRACMVKCVLFLDGASGIIHMAFFCIFCSPRWFPFSTHAILLMFHALCKYPFFDSPIYFPLHEQSSWYTLDWLFGTSFSLFFWKRIYCRFFPDVKAISFPIFLNSRFSFRLMFEIQGKFFRLVYLHFVCCFHGYSYYSFYCYILPLYFSRVVCYDHFQRTYWLKIFLLL